MSTILTVSLPLPEKKSIIESWTVAQVGNHFNHIFIRKRFNLLINNLLDMRYCIIHESKPISSYFRDVCIHSAALPGAKVSWQSAGHHYVPGHNGHDLVPPISVEPSPALLIQGGTAFVYLLFYTACVWWNSALDRMPLCLCDQVTNNCFFLR